MTGYSREDHLASMLQKIDHVRKAVKDSVREQKLTNLLVANVAKETLASTGPWTDAITPNIGGYQSILTRVYEEVSARLAEQADSKKRQAPAEGQPEAKRGRRPDNRTGSSSSSWRSSGGGTPWRTTNNRGGSGPDRRGRGSRGPRGHWRGGRF